MTKKLAAAESLPVSVVVLNASGIIVGVNDVWAQFGHHNGLRLPHSGLGLNYLDYCGPADAQPSVANDLRELLAGRRDLVMHVYPCDSPDEKRWFLLLAFRLSVSESISVVVLHTNISSIVPLPVVEGQKRERRATAEQAVNSLSLAAMYARVEASVSEALSSQLHAMLAPQARRPGEVSAASKTPDEDVPSAKLSRREMDVLRLLGEGKTNREIAKLLFRSPNTIKLHISAIFRKLNLKSRTQAALLASKLPNQR